MDQIGISNVPDARLGTHRGNGWEEVGLAGPMPGSDAVDLERRLLRAIEERGAEIGVLTSKGRFDGYTESWPIKSLRVRSFDQLLKWAESASGPVRRPELSKQGNPPISLSGQKAGRALGLVQLAPAERLHRHRLAA